ncbi:MAG: hypothetical protein B0W54_05010 [Cellvibrio sp. 79]|nr:MAG: hypothetical protein B0W54_05010 [Cellvibrio sp. 79]
MGNPRKDEFLNWLCEANALEKQTERLFEAQAEYYEDYPNIQVSLSAEINHSKHFQKLLVDKIDALDKGSIITRRDDEFIANTQNVLGMETVDQPVKGVLALHTFTQLEIGTFKILKAAASAENQDDLLLLSESIIMHLEARAAWLEQELDHVTRKYLLRKAA